MLRIVRNFRDGMGDRVRTDSTHSECNDFTRGLRQGCVLSPLLCNVFFAAALRVVLVRFSQDEDIVRDLVQLSDTGVQ